MAELLHVSRGAGIQGPMTNAPPAQHRVFTPPQPEASPPWLHGGPEPLQGFAVDGGVRHKQAEPYVGAASAAAAALGDDLIGREPRRRTPSGVATPYQKAAAQRSAERALRPWEPVAGLGERRGAPHLKVPGANAGVEAFAAPDAPSLFVAPTAAQVEAVAAAAGRVTRGGQGQPGAEGAFGPAEVGRPVRELWPVALLNQPPKYCTACRGPHEAAKVNTPDWQPYTPAKRLANLQLVDTRFRAAMKKGLLCCSTADTSSGAPVRWSVQPQAMGQQQFTQQLALAFDGVREGHEPFRFLASQAVEDLLAFGATTPRASSTPPAAKPAAAAAAAAKVQPKQQRREPQKGSAAPPQPPRQQSLQPQQVPAQPPQRRAQTGGPSADAPASGGDGRNGAGSNRTNWVAAAVPELVAPIKLCLNTMQPELVGGLLLLLIRMLRCHPAVPSALAPYSRHVLPTLAVFRSHCRSMLLPAPRCLPATGSFSGSGAPRGDGPRSCRVCGSPLYGEYERQAAAKATPADPAAAAEAAAKAGQGRLPGRFCHRYTLEALVEEVLGLLAADGGELGRRMVGNYIPGFNYYSPGDQPPCPTVEEILEQQQRPTAAGGVPARRPSSAPRSTGRRPASGAPATTGANTGGRAAKGRGGRGARRRSSGGIKAATDLSRWDGIEFRDVPYGEAVRQEQMAELPLELGGGGGGGVARLRVSTPVPIFASPYDPLYRVLTEGYDTPVVARLRGAASGARGAAKGGPDGKPGVRRGGSGGGGARGPLYVNAEVPYKDSPAGFRRGL